MKAMVSEVFGPTVQGEGPVIGQRTIFVRFFGCDSLCSLCDSMHAVDPKHPGAASRRMMDFDTIVKEVRELDPDNLGTPVTFSGGNPMMWQLGELVQALQQVGHPVWVETQGTIYRPWAEMCDRVIVSPKGPGMQDQKNGVFPPRDLFTWAEITRRSYASQGDLWMKRPEVAFKVVLMTPEDIYYAEEIAVRFRDIPLYLSVGNPDPPPAAASTERLLARLRATTAQVLARPLLRHAILLPQLHVLLWGNQQGV